MNEANSKTGQNRDKAVHLIARGRVQGVGFRYYTRVHADRLGLSGWVRNRQDGTVEVWAEGTEGQLKQLIRAIQQGPTHSGVDRVDVEWSSPKGRERGFRIRY
ncbi:MAG: acylphosphatase [Anaerolineae bacterium]